MAEIIPPNTLGQPVPIQRGPAGLESLEWAGDPFAAQPAAAAGLGRRPTPALLWRFKWLALGVFALIAVPAVVGVKLTQKPTYEARGVVQVMPVTPRIVYRSDENGQTPFYEQTLNNQVEVLRGPAVLNRVLDAIKDTKWYGEQDKSLLGGAPRSNLERLREELEVSVRPRTSYIDVKMAAASGEEAARIVNSVLDEYLRETDGSTRGPDIGSSVYVSVTNQYNSLKERIETLSKSVELLGQGSALMTTASPEELLVQQRKRLDERQSELADLQREIALAEWELGEVSKLVTTTTQPAEGEAAAAAADDKMPPFVVDAEWRRLNQAVKQAEFRLETEGAALGEAHYRKIEMSKAVEHAREALRNRESELEIVWQTQGATNWAAGGEGGGATGGAAAPGALQTIQRRLDRLRKQEEIVQGLVDQELRQFKEVDSKARQLARELEVLGHAKAQFADVRARKDALEIEGQAPADIRIQSKAFAPTQPSNGKRTLMLMAMAVAGAAACGLGAAYLRASTIPAVQQASDLAPCVTAPFLGHMPLRRRGGTQSEAIEGECVRMIRTALLERLGEEKGHVIQITSAGAGAGKSTTALLLARSLARCGKRVLLVDSDLRHPMLGEQCGLASEPGLLGVLRDRVADKAAIVHSEGNLSLLPAGRLAAEDDAELLANGVLAACVKRWRGQYDLVLFDGSPLLPVADARILSRQVDGNVLVVREAHCRRAEVSEALAHLQSAGGRLTGVVFYGRGGGGAYAAGYGYGYGYGARPEAAPEPVGAGAEG